VLQPEAESLNLGEQDGNLVPQNLALFAQPFKGNLHVVNPRLPEG
jgi:hypothetical protein